MEILKADFVRVLRAEILKAAYESHSLRLPRLSLVPLQTHLDRLHFDVSEDDLATVLEDLKDRGYVSYERDEVAWRKHRRLRIGKIQATPAGRDLVEQTKADPAVQFN